MSNIWHDINPSRIQPEDFIAVIEIPKGSKKKYELDKETGLIILVLKIQRERHARKHLKKLFADLGKGSGEHVMPALKVTAHDGYYRREQHRGREHSAAQHDRGFTLNGRERPCKKEHKHRARNTYCAVQAECRAIGPLRPAGGNQARHASGNTGSGYR